MDFRSPPVPRKISPVPLPTQCPAHHLPAARSTCPSPPRPGHTAAEGELSMARGMCHSKGVRAPIPKFGPGRATDPKSSSPSSFESPSFPLVPASSAPPERPPVPAPRKRPPVPDPPERPPVPAPRKCPPVPAPRKCPPSHPLLPTPPLSSGSPSARPQPTIITVRARRDYHPPALPWSEFPPLRPGLRLSPLTRQLHRGS